MAMDLRPLNLGELLDRSFSLYRAHLGTLIALMAAPAACAAGLGIVVEVFPASLNGSPPSLGEIAGLAGLLALTCVLVAAYFVTYAVAVGATTAAVSEIYMGRPSTATDAFRRVRGRIGALVLLLLQISMRLLAFLAVGTIIAVPAGLGLGILMGMVLPSTLSWLVGLAFLSLVGVVFLLMAGFAARYALSFAALILEPLSTQQAIRRSVELTRGHFGRVLLLFLFATVITYIAALLFQGPFLLGAAVAGATAPAGRWLSLAGGVAGAVSGAVSAPILVVALVLLYYDARIRQEGLDLQIMMHRLDTAPPPPPGTPASPAILPG